ncbi:hypothetical protein [Streptomyces sp. HD]|nr:hypothetical protein [Streptomyces sp. HD]MDC0766335.1 hypothetical protein [Streptomyces sp. HD]
MPTTVTVLPTAMPRTFAVAADRSTRAMPRVSCFVRHRILGEAAAGYSH